MIRLLTLLLILPASALTVMWNPNPEPDIACYLVSVLPPVPYAERVIDAGKQTQLTIPGLQEGMTYQLTLVAVNAAGLRSEPSAPISYTVPTTGPRVRLVIERSEDLKTWSELPAVELPLKDHEFFRLKLTTDNQ